MSPRYDESQTNHSRHGFDNLILLCNVHHKVIDDDPTSFTVKRLLAMKQGHEAVHSASPQNEEASEHFATSIVAAGNSGDVVQATNVSGGQVAHTINNYTSATDDLVLEGKTKLSTDNILVGCPYLELTVICKSQTPAKIRRAVISLVDQGIIASLETGFGKSFGCTPLPGSGEELTIELLPRQKPNLAHGFIVTQNDIAQFILPALAAPLGLFVIRPADSMSLKVELLDQTMVVLVDGIVLKPHLEGLIEIAATIPCEPRFPPVPINVSVKSFTLPDLNLVGTANSNRVEFGLQVSETEHPPAPTPARQEGKIIPWHKRTGNFVPYPEMRQGRLDHCVYAAIASGINHLIQREVWTPTSLFEEHRRQGSYVADFGVADIAVRPVSNSVDSFNHAKDCADQRPISELIRKWIGDGSVVILSMELRNDDISRRGGWHMFSLVARDGGSFQVWDTNGLRGFMTSEELEKGFYYPNGWFFMPHDRQDALILRRKRL